MAKLADESESFESHTIFGLLRGAPDLTPNINNVESMFEPASEESMWPPFSNVFVDFFDLNLMIFYRYRRAYTSAGQRQSIRRDS